MFSVLRKIKNCIYNKSNHSESENVDDSSPSISRSSSERKHRCFVNAANTNVCTSEI